MSRIRKGLVAAAVTAIATALAAAAHAETTLRVHTSTDLQIFDPIWTTNELTQNHGYMVYDTLFSMDENMRPQPQMVDRFEVSPNSMTYTFTLRDGLKWHDGAPVTTADVIASLKRWGAKDAMGIKLMQATATLEAVDDKTFRLVLAKPFGLVTEALASVVAHVPFIMPERVARTDPSEQIQETVGSGPFIFDREAWRPGEKAVYVKNAAYVPRDEPPSGMAGGHVAKVDKVEFVFIPDEGTALAALQSGEIDFFDQPPADLVPIMQSDENLTVESLTDIGHMGVLRFNFLNPPFDNPDARRAVVWATSQEQYMRTAIGDSAPWKVCGSYFACGTPYETDAGNEAFVNTDLDKAKELLAKSGYDGRPIVFLRPDWPFHMAQTAVTVEQLRKIGFNVDVQAMSLQTFFERRQLKAPVDQGGWNLFHTDIPGIATGPERSILIASSCDQTGWPGWPCNEKIDQLQNQFLGEPDFEKRKQIAAEIQREAMDYVTHNVSGQFFKQTAYRDALNGVLRTPARVFWNISKTED